MAETLRELVVALSLDSSNFSRNMRTINQQIKEAESTFRLAGAGVENYEKTIAGTESKLSMLGQKLTQQQRAVDQYSRALVAVNGKLQENYTRQVEYTRRLEAARARQQRLRLEVDDAARAYQHYRTTLGESDSATIAAAANLDRCRQEYVEARNEVKKLEGQVEALKKTMQNSADTVSKAQTDLNNAKAAAKDTEAEIKKLTEQLYRMQSGWTRAGESLTAFSKKCETLSRAMTKAGKTLTATVTTPIVALGTTAVKASIDYEYAFANVRKTVDATEEEFAQLSDQVKKMSTELAAPAEEIAEVMAVAGQLGIETDKLADFTRVMIDLGNSTNMVASEAASEAARFANITGMTQDQFQNLGSTLVDLGNNYATTEAEIMEMSLRLAGAGKQIGLTEAQILGMSTALSAVGIQAQMGGSAMSKALIKMEVAAATGGQALTDFAKVSGLTEKEFVEQWKNDPVQVFQRFISNLAKMSDEGISTVAVLNEIGISEIRLRDTLLRTVNASELFNKTQITANRAWAENAALTNEANKRYATTKARLTNLKNTALMFARQIGDDLNPAIQQVIDKVNDLLQKFLSMDATQRQAIVKWAAFAAAVGPVVLVLGKVVGAAGTVAGALGKTFAALGKVSASVSMAGGGLGGFVKVLASSKLAIVGLAAALVYGAIKLADYATGAKAAREALEGMAKTAQNWRDTAAKTFYSESEGLSAFGMSKEDFTSGTKSAQQWMEGLVKVWTDGEKESDEIVQKWTESWKGLTGSTRDELKKLKDAADEAGYDTVSEDLADDIKKLDSMDKEIESLLKKRQNGFLTDNEKLRLQELIDTREAITVKYNLVPDSNTDGFDTIEKKVEAAVARAHAMGKEDTYLSVYQDAVVAAAEGMAQINAELDEQYEKEYKLISLITDEDERTAKQEALDTRYSEQRRAAALEYAETLSKVAAPVFDQDSIKETEEQLFGKNGLYAKMTEYGYASESERRGMLPELAAFAESLDESSLTEYLGLLTQIQALLDQGMTKEEINAMFPDVSEPLDHYAGIVQFLKDNKADLPGLYSMFGEAAPEEVLKIATDLDMTGAQARWDEFANNPGSITTDAIVKSYDDSKTTVPQPKVDAHIAKYTEVPAGADKAELTPEGLVAYVSAYAKKSPNLSTANITPDNVQALVAAYQEIDAGADMSALTPDEIVARVSEYLEQNGGADTELLTPDDIKAFVMAYEEVSGGASTTRLTPEDILARVNAYAEESGADTSALTPKDIKAMVAAYEELNGRADISDLKPEDIVAYIAQYNADDADLSGISPEAITAFVAAYQEIDGGAYTGLLTPKDIAAMVDEYLEADGVDKRDLKPDQIEALVSAYAEATGCDKDELLKHFTADIEGYDDTGATVPKPKTQVLITGYDLKAYRSFAKANPDLALEIPTRLGMLSSAEWEAYKTNGKLKVWKDGVEIPATPEVTSKLTADTVAVLDEDGTLHVFVTPEYTGSPEAIEDARDALEKPVEVLSEDAAATVAALTNSWVGYMSTLGRVDAALQRLDKYNNHSFFSGSVQDLDKSLEGDFQSQEAAELGIYVGELAKAVATGAEISEEDAAHLQKIFDLVSGLEKLEADEGVEGIGTNIRAGIANGLTEAGAWDEDAETVTEAMEAAFNSVLQIHSPSVRMQPIGTNVAAGIGAGMKLYDPTTDATTTADNIRTAVEGKLTRLTLVGVGLNAMAGLATGIRLGQISVINAMREAAQAAVRAAKDELDIHSPSKVFRDEVGVNVMKGFGEGVLKGTLQQARIISNASRFLTGEAREGSIAYNTNDNRKTYNSTSSVNLSGNTFYVRDQSDVRSLAIEIAALTKRQQRGQGLRFA